MSISFGVRDLARLTDEDEPISVVGMLWVADDEVRLYDWEGARSAAVADPEARAALRSALSPSGEYLGDALLFAWVRAGEGGPELHGVYWVALGCPERWGPEVAVRPVPPEHTYYLR